MNKLLLFLFVLCLLTNSCAQKDIAYPPGLTIDPGIEKIVKSKKGNNTFKVEHFINDTISTMPLLNNANKLALTALSTIDKGDTVLLFTGMMIPWGFYINLKSTEPEIGTMVSSRSCKCFKDSLSKTELSYGAGVKSDSFTLVLNKIKDIKAGDKIYGYLKTRGANIYHFSRTGEGYEKWNFQYEGFFEATFNPIKL